MKMAQTEVYEVATFYAHFDVVKEGETPPPAVTVRVCDSLSCAMAGADNLLADLPGKLGERCPRHARALHGRVRPARRSARSAMCRCSSATPRRSHAAVQAAPHAHALQAGRRLRRVSGGRAATRCSNACLDGKRTRDDMIKAVERRRPARPWRRGLPDRPQVDAGARRNRARA